MPCQCERRREKNEGVMVPRRVRARGLQQHGDLRCIANGYFYSTWRGREGSLRKQMIGDLREERMKAAGRGRLGQPSLPNPRRRPRGPQKHVNLRNEAKLKTRRYAQKGRNVNELYRLQKNDKWLRFFTPDKALALWRRGSLNL